MQRYRFEFLKITRVSKVSKVMSDGSWTKKLLAVEHRHGNPFGCRKPRFTHSDRAKYSFRKPKFFGNKLGGKSSCWNPTHHHHPQPSLVVARRYQRPTNHHECRVRKTIWAGLLCTNLSEILGAGGGGIHVRSKFFQEICRPHAVLLNIFFHVYQQEAGNLLDFQSQNNRQLQQEGPPG